VDWIELAQDRQLEGCCECGSGPSSSVKCWEAALSSIELVGLENPISPTGYQLDFIVHMRIVCTWRVLYNKIGAVLYGE
jgi:hypothetical protein